jgi:hypothetical protein
MEEIKKSGPKHHGAAAAREQAGVSGRGPEGQQYKQEEEGEEAKHQEQQTKAYD